MTPSKKCSRCREIKPVEQFYKQGEHSWRPACKACTKVQAKEYGQEGRRYQGPAVESIPMDARVHSYRSVIDRMVGLGIMSKDTAKESLARVAEMEKAES